MVRVWPLLSEDTSPVALWMSSQCRSLRAGLSKQERVGSHDRNSITFEWSCDIILFDGDNSVRGIKGQ